MIKLLYFACAAIITAMLCGCHIRRGQKAAMGFPGYAREEYDNQLDLESGWC